MNLREHAADISDSLPLASAVVQEVRVWGPVGRLVGSDRTRGAVRGNEGSVVSNLAESCRKWSVSSALDLFSKGKHTLATENLMNVRSDRAVGDERVNSSLTADTSALHAPEGRGRRAQQGEGSGDKL